MMHNLIPCLILLTAYVTPTQFSFGQSQSVGIFDGHGDVGASVKPGSAILSELPFLIGEFRDAKLINCSAGEKILVLARNNNQLIFIF